MTPLWLTFLSRERSADRMNSSSMESRPSREAWTNMWWLAGAFVLCMSPWFSASAVIPQLDAAWTLSANEAAWLTISVQLGFVVGAVLSSLVNLPDLVAPRALVIGGALGAAVANLGILTASGAGQAIMWRSLTGVCLALVYPPGMKLIATWFTQGRGTALGILIGALTMGAALPHLVNSTGGAGWQMVITATSAFTAAGAIVVALRVKEGPFPFPKAVFSPRLTGAAMANPKLRLATIGYVGHMWELYAMWAWFAAFASAALRNQGIQSASVASLVTFVVVGVGALGCWAGGVIGDRFGKETSASLMMMTSATCAITIGLFYSGPIWLLLTVGIVWGFSVVGDSAQFSAIATEVTHQAYVGTALTIQLAVGYIVTTVTIWIIPLVAQVVGWQWVFVILVPGPLIGSVAMVHLKRVRKLAVDR